MYTFEIKKKMAAEGEGLQKGNLFESRKEKPQDAEVKPAIKKYDLLMSA